MKIYERQSTSELLNLVVAIVEENRTMPYASIVEQNMQMLAAIKEVLATRSVEVN